MRARLAVSKLTRGAASRRHLSSASAIPSVLSATNQQPFTFSTTRFVRHAPGDHANAICDALLKLHVHEPQDLVANATVRRAAGMPPHVAPGATVVLVTDKGIVDRKMEIPTLQALKERGYDVVMFGSVEPEPPTSNVEACAQLCRDVNACAVIGFGGGSSLDVAKLAAFLAHPAQKQRIGDCYGVDACRGPRLPLIQVPTTAGTGSEVTPISIVTASHHAGAAKEKKGVVSPQLYPDFAILDGGLTLTLPRAVTAYSGIDASVHAMEAFTSRLLKNPMSDLFAREALRLIGANIRRVCDEKDKSGPLDLAARQAMLAGSCFAGMAFANAPVGAVHVCAYPVGTHFNVPHGLSISLVLPHVVRFNELENPVALELYREVRQLLFQKSSPVGSKSSGLADDFLELADSLGLPTKLSQVGVEEKHVEPLAADAMLQTRLIPNNIKTLTKKDAADIFRAAL